MKKLLLCCLIPAALACFSTDCKREKAEPQELAEEKPAQPVEKEPEIQQPIVAGGFYKANPEQLKEQINEYIQAADLKDLAGKPFGFVVPHAGYEYSGPTAAYAYKAIGQSKVKRFVILAPSHRLFAEKVSVLDKDFYRTPLGLVKIDRKKVKELIGMKGWITYAPELFDQEHSLEVQLPFLQETAGQDIEIIPIVMGTPVLEMAQKLAMVLYKAFEGEDVIYIASSDMSHYFTYDVANQMDSLALSRMLSLDINKLENDLKYRKAQCCGAGPIFTLMTIFKKKGGTLVEVLDHRNSGDTAGTKDRVVGYASVAFLLTGEEEPAPEPEPEAPKPAAQALIPPEDYDLTLEEKKELMQIARTTVETYVKENRIPEFEVKDEKLKETGAAFVTLKKNGELRGCIGHLVARNPLYVCVRQVAASAAKHDMRFYPVTPEELPDLEYEISVLSPMKLVLKLDDIMVGRDGLQIEYGVHSGVLLPQVPLEYGWNRDEFLSHTCIKAGLDQDCWKDTRGVRIRRFQALVFSEKDLENKRPEDAE